MARLIEIADLKVAAELSVRVGDVLLVRAAGGRIRTGEEVVEFLGPFVAAVVGDDGNVYTPMGPPNVLLFRAVRAGLGRVEIITGEPFGSPVSSTELRITAET